MIPLVVLAQTPFVAKDAGLSWTFPGEVKVGKGRIELKGRGLGGEILWFVAKGGRFDAETLYADDTQRTKEADASKRFTHVRKAIRLAGLPAIESDQRYLWNESAVASRCVYCAAANRAWVVRLWWPLDEGKGEAAATAFLKTVRQEKGKQ